MKETNEDDAVERMLNELEGLLKQQYTGPLTGPQASTPSFDPDATEELDTFVAPPAHVSEPAAASTRLSDIARLAVNEHHDVLAYAVDTKGNRICTIRFKDLKTGDLLPDTLVEVSSNITWAADGRSTVASTTWACTFSKPQSSNCFRVGSSAQRPKGISMKCGGSASK